MKRNGDSIMLSMWVIYENPSDYQGLYVARKFVNGTPTEEHITAESLDDIRKQIPQGLKKIPRTTQDDPVIVETWI